jgi:mevalonate pyrophosphate decarboxylase
MRGEAVVEVGVEHRRQLLALLAREGAAAVAAAAAAATEGLEGALGTSTATRPSCVERGKRIGSASTAKSARSDPYFAQTCLCRPLAFGF